jgi:putative SOS response-associated peptidase YedK
VNRNGGRLACVDGRPFAKLSSAAAALCRSTISTNGKRTATGNQPYAIALSDRRLVALAGLWENWRLPAAEWVRTFAIITTAPNELCAELHNRMPAVLKPEAWSLWLGEEPAELKALLTPFPSEEMTCWPVSSRVGNVRNNDASLIEPIAA